MVNICRYFNIMYAFCTVGNEAEEAGERFVTVHGCRQFVSARQLAHTALPDSKPPSISFGRGVNYNDGSFVSLALLLAPCIS